MPLPEVGKIALVPVGTLAFGLLTGFSLVGAFAQFLNQLIAQGVSFRRRSFDPSRQSGRSEHPDQLGHEDVALAAFHADLIASDLAVFDLALNGALAGAESLSGLGQGDIGLCHGVPVTG